MHLEQLVFRVPLGVGREVSLTIVPVEAAETGVFQLTASGGTGVASFFRRIGDGRWGVSDVATGSLVTDPQLTVLDADSFYRVVHELMVGLPQ